MKILSSVHLWHVYVRHCGHVRTNDAHKKFIHDVLIIRYNILWKWCRLTALLLSSARPMHI